jgi:RNA polymerase sigma factor (sigma-70 family)
MDSKNTVTQKILDSDFLTNRQKRILELRMKGLTLKSIGQELGVTRERIRQIGEKIKRKLKENLSPEELGQYIRERKSIP